jgi:multidrug resistance efflux pump
MSKYSGQIKSRIVSVRFAISGKIVSFKKHTGDTVKKGEVLASLDTKMLQTSLDKELSDFEKVRADFEIFAQKYPDPQEAIDKYLKTEKQASLNASVKDVELAKAVLDQTILFSPVDGVIIDDNDLTAGVYITPAGSEIKIADSSSYFLETEIEQKDISDFAESKKCKVEIPGIKDKIESESSPVLSDGKIFIVKINIPNVPGILLGLKGVARF